MSRGYSLDLRTRLVECVEAGASRHEAAERFEVSVSSAVRWMQRFVRFGSVAAKPSGGSTSPLEAHAAWLLELVAQHPDLTLDEIVAAMRREAIAGSRTAVWRFFAGFFSHASGVLPAFTSSFSSRLLRCLGTGTIVASIIWPPRAM